VAGPARIRRGAQPGLRSHGTSSEPAPGRSRNPRVYVSVPFHSISGLTLRLRPVDGRAEERWRGFSQERARAGSKTMGYLHAQRIPSKTRWNVAPWSGSVLAQSRPRWRSMIERLIDSHMPSPSAYRRVERLPTGRRHGLPRSSARPTGSVAAVTSRTTSTAFTSRLRRRHGEDLRELRLRLRSRLHVWDPGALSGRGLRRFASLRRSFGLPCNAPYLQITVRRLGVCGGNWLEDDRDRRGGTSAMGNPLLPLL
jgi:hypothetical protein